MLPDYMLYYTVRIRYTINILMVYLLNYINKQNKCIYGAPGSENITQI